MNLEKLKSLEPQIIIEHGMAGFLYHHEQIAEYKPQWQTQWYRNSYYLKKTNQVLEKLHKAGIEVIVLKGMHLIKNIYSDIGMRSMGDIDFYIKDHDQYEQSRDIILAMGFNTIPCKKWKANNFKSNYSIYEDGLEIALEVHNHLLFDKIYDWQTTKLENYQVLALEDNIVYLIGHMAYQHTFLKLSWLHDIYLILCKYEKEIDWQKVIEISKRTKLSKSLQATVVAVHKMYGYKINIPKINVGYFTIKLFQSIIDINFLANPKQSRLKYYLLKHLLKDSFWKAITYNFLWVINRAWKD